MIHRFLEKAGRAGIAVCLSVVCGAFTACTDDYDLDDPGNYPSWLGNSIYEAMKHPEALTAGTGNVLQGTFTNYLRLIDDLGYAETLGKTGSKTVFPANDEAFERFYQNNSWGVRRYEDLTEAMKRQLLYGSMLDNAILVEMLANISDNRQNPPVSVIQGQALKHTTGADVIDTITFMPNQAAMPVNNSYWEKYYDDGLYIVMDATKPMMVHFTEEQMTNNEITTKGENSDFEVITGTPYDEDEHSAYVFRNKIIIPDITCKNGYIHQMQDVLVPPGNMAEVIRTNGESNLFSRMLDRFSAPYEDAATTKRYNDWYQEQVNAGLDVTGLAHPEKIYQKRYMSQRSEGVNSTQKMRDPNGNELTYVLSYDPGWNNYNSGATGEDPLKDIAAMFVPTDKAMQDYFLPGGEGSFLMDAFGKKPNTMENLEENIDSIPLQNVHQIVDNLMQSSFTGTVPSKFGRVMDEANDPMGISLESLNKNENGVYDVKIANNGVIYMLNKVFAPPSLIAVSAPVTLNSNMRIMNVAVNDGNHNTTTLNLAQNYYAYLLAMSANYAFFIPTDDAFANYYVDPAYLLNDPDIQPRALKFYYQNKSPYVYCSKWKYDPITHTVGTEPSDSLGMVTTEDIRRLFIDLLNYHTIVLKDGETLGTNKFYKTKHGGAVMFDGNHVLSGSQIEGTRPVSNITQTYNQANGQAYAIDHIIEPPHTSVLNVIEDSTRFKMFYDLCTANMDSIMYFAGEWFYQKHPLWTDKNKIRRSLYYHPFANKNGLTDNVNYFNSYNYTVYAPDDAAMTLAYQRGLPTWNDIKALVDKWYPRYLENKETIERETAASTGTGDNIVFYTNWERMIQCHALPPGEEAELIADRNKALAMVEAINSFVRYHFQDNSVFADNVIETGEFPTACSDTLGIRQKLTIGGGDGRILVNDASGQTITIDANNASLLSNQMARDYVITTSGSGRNKKCILATSSFAVVHQISTPLCSNPGTQRYDGAWTGANAAARLKAFRRLFEERLYKRYTN